MSATPLPRAPLQSWQGIGAVLAERLARLGVREPEDLLWLIPLRYEDLTTVTPIAALTTGALALVEGEVVRVTQERAHRTRNRPILTAILADATGTLVGRWIHWYPSLQQRLQPGRRWRWYAEVRPHYFGGHEMVHPRLIDPKVPLPTTLTPVYPATEGLNQSQLRRWVAQALAVVPLSEWLSADECNRLGLPPLPEALRLIHSPPKGVMPHSPYWQAARARLALDELIAQQASMRRARQARLGWGAPAISGTESDQAAARFIARLPFSLTSAQLRVSNEVAQDLARPTPMHRLVLGDVGSGKTVVAAVALARTVAAGYQAALLVPTEIVAQQHAAKLSQWFAEWVPVALITATTARSERNAWLERLGCGEPIIVVGTHALLEEKIVLPRLALAVIDEQHRFGVRQRALVREKSPAWRPHLLMMSATPIPRTLAMACYADLDLSFLDEKPPGRQPVVTTLVARQREAELIARVGAWCAQGKQAYWVCPVIDESEVLDVTAAQKRYLELRAALPNLSIGLLHGRMRPNEREEVMAKFVAGKLALLVATTVIEVGVDVPNASLMVIEHAERFGMAQLHQLRGRVGRGGERSYCALFYEEPLSPLARERLMTLKNEEDGFKIAQIDLRLRGPGEITGVRQSGVPLMRIADLVTDESLIPHAQQLAERLIDKAPQLADQLIARWVPQASWATHA